MLSNCLCDPHKRTYISAILTATEAVAFGTLNIVLICMNTCAIKPPIKIPLAFDKFWAWYFYDEAACVSSGHDYSSVSWINTSYPIERRPQTNVQSNLNYQIAYLALHSLWFLSALVLLYGNARKLWGYYVPWLLITLTLLIMDLTLSVFFIEDIVDAVKAKKYNSAMTWIMCLYFRLFIFWILNLEEFATGCNAFCKSYHKRSKQARLKVKQEKKMAVEVEKAAAVADEAARAEMREQQEAERQRQEQEAEHQRQQQQEERERQQQFEALGVDNDAYEEIPLASQIKERPPVAKKPSVPPELRPFNYLNPFFRPTDQHDIEGMRANPAFEEPLINLKRNSSGISNKEDYFPFDGYIKPTDTLPVAPDPLTRRHGSMRNLNSQPPQHHVKRSFSTRDPPDDYPRSNSNSKYTGAWDTNTRPSNNLVGLPRIHLAEGKAVLRPPRDTDFLTHQEEHPLPPHRPSYPHPSSQPRPYVPPHDQEAHYSPTDRDRHYFPSSNQERPYVPPSSQERPYVPPSNQERPYVPPSNQERPYVPSSSQERPYVPSSNQERDYFPMESQERKYSPQRTNMAPPPPASRKHQPQDISQTYYI